MANKSDKLKNIKVSFIWWSILVMLSFFQVLYIFGTSARPWKLWACSTALLIGLFFMYMLYRQYNKIRALS